MAAHPLLASALLLAGCAYEPVCVDLRPVPELSNHVQPFEVALDPVARRAYSTALGSRVVLVFDADSGDAVGELPLVHGPLTTPDIELDADGDVWIASATGPAVTEFVGATGERRTHWTDLDGARDLAARVDGGMVVLGRRGTDNDTVVAYDRAGEPELVRRFDQPIHGLIPLDGGARIGLTTGESELIVVGSADLAELDRCEAGIPEAFHGAQLEDGSVVLATEHAIGTACVDAPQGWLVGEENMEVIALGDHALVLDRIGAEPGWDPNLGVGRLVDPLLGVTGRYPTAKNTGFGALDPVTGRLWANSEGTSEMVLLDPETGQLEQAIRTGTFLDGLAMDPDDSRVSFVSGRLSDTLARLEDGAMTASTDAVHWPYSPVVDPPRDLVWVMSQTESTVFGLRRSDLALMRSLDPGLGSNTLLTFGALALHTARGTLFLAQSQADVLVELDPDSGAVVQRWDLGGPSVADRDEVGELAIRVDPGSGLLYLARSNDARVQRVDPAQGTLETTFLPEEVVLALADGHKTDFFRLIPQRGLLWVGSKAVRMGTLARAPEHDLRVTRMAGPDPLQVGWMLAVDDARGHIVRLDDQGAERGRRGFATRDLHASVFRINHDDRSVVMTRALHGNVCSFSVEGVRH